MDIWKRIDVIWCISYKFLGISATKMVSFTFPQFPAAPPEWYIWLRASQDSLRVPWPLSWWRQARRLDRWWLPAYLSDTQWHVQGGGSKIGRCLCYQWCRWNPGTWWPSFSQAVRRLDRAFCHPHAKGTSNVFVCCCSNVLNEWVRFKIGHCSLFFKKKLGYFYFKLDKYSNLTTGWFCS